jgi:hypothetical protein
VFVASETERTTAATDALLGLLCLGLAAAFATHPLVGDGLRWKRHVWVAAFACLAGGSMLGAVAHGFVLSDSVKATLWRPLYLLLGLSVAFVAVGALHDWRGEAAARVLLPWAMVSAVGFFAVTQIRDGAFVLFLAYEGVAMLFALAVYLSLAARAGMPGAAVVAAGLAMTLVAAAVQASSLSLRVGVTFDHNGLFHLIQMPALVLIAAGVRASLHD